MIALRGNHEDFIISLFMGNLNLRDREIWLTINGGRITLASYRNKGHHLNVHQEFYMNLTHCFETEGFFFCRAGVRPGVPLKDQRKTDLLEIDEPFFSSDRDFGKIVVHGHTITEQAVIKHKWGRDRHRRGSSWPAFRHRTAVSEDLGIQGKRIGDTQVR